MIFRQPVMDGTKLIVEIQNTQSSVSPGCGCSGVLWNVVRLLKLKRNVWSLNRCSRCLVFKLYICLAPQNTNYESIQQTARSIAEQAHVLAYDPNYMSPFAQFACDNGLNVRGEYLSSHNQQRNWCSVLLVHSGFIGQKDNVWILCESKQNTLTEHWVLSVQEESQMTSQCCCP